MKTIYLVFRDWDCDGMEFVAAYESRQGAENLIYQKELEYYDSCGSHSFFPYVIEESELK